MTTSLLSHVNAPPRENRFATDTARWRAVEARDPTADGAFVFAVRTTGVYCRPSCPSRAPRLANVRFFATCDDAERAGFRPCRRCTPRREAADTPLAAAVAAACRALLTRDRAPSLASLARAAGYSPAHFHRAFRRLVGMTPRAYAEAHRLQALRGDIANASTVTGAIVDAGFASPSRVYARGRSALGMTPGAYRRRGEAQDIRYAVAECSLGSLLVATTAEGVCAIELGDDAPSLEQALRARFGAARRVDADPALARHVASIVAFIDAPHAALALPLDIRGTAFQHRVWQALQRIPVGECTSYGELARRIGAPSSVRAVARAIATNPVALVIPCHRVIAKDGTLAGYRWGVERKAALLARERDAVVTPTDKPPRKHRTA